jgi:acyl-CoA thioesterase-1
VIDLVRRRSFSIVILLAVIIGGGSFWWTSRDRGVAADPPVYVALGASDAVGVGADDPSSQGWVPLVARGLPANPNLVNLGISGATIADVNTDELPVAIDARPDWITIWPGVNDLRHDVSLDSFTDGLNTTLDRLRSDTSAQIIIMNIPDLRNVPAFTSLDPDTLDQTVRQWNAAIDQAATSHGALLVDLYGNSQEVTGHPEDISSDGFHPSSAGYRQIADLVLKTVRAHVSPAP